MYTFTDDDRREIKAAVHSAEQRTSGEFVALVARTSDSYRSAALLWAAGLALVAPAPLLLFTHLRFLDIYQLQILVFIACMLVL